MTFNTLLCIDKQLTLDVSIVRSLLLIDNRYNRYNRYRALCKALRKATLDVVIIREGDKILKSILNRQRATSFPNY